MLSSAGAFAALKMALLKNKRLSATHVKQEASTSNLELH